MPATGAALLGEGVHEPKYDPVRSSQHPADSPAGQHEGVHGSHTSRVEAALQATGARSGRPVHSVRETSSMGVCVYVCACVNVCVMEIYILSEHLVYPMFLLCGIVN